jgi:DNA-binding NarL/FixJ family response regulator
VFICDDSPEFCTLMRAALEAEPGLEVVGEARSGEACLARVQQVRPDHDGLWALPRIRASLPDCTVVVVSALSERWMGERVRAAGASDYIQKGAPLSRIVSAARAAAGAEDR